MFPYAKATVVLLYWFCNEPSVLRLHGTLSDYRYPKPDVCGGLRGVLGYLVSTPCLYLVYMCHVPCLYDVLLSAFSAPELSGNACVRSPAPAPAARALTLAHRAPAMGQRRACWTSMRRGSRKFPRTPSLSCTPSRLASATGLGRWATCSEAAWCGAEL